MQNLVVVAGLLALSGCGASPPVERAAPPDSLAAVSIPVLPAWTDRYAAYNQGDVRFFNISKLMAAHDLTRLQAVALQNHYRDLTRADPEGVRATQFDEALARVRRGEYESGLDPERLAAAPFIVVFDLDDTLYDQYRSTEACHTFRTTHAGNKQRLVQLVPGWKDAFDRVRAAGGLVVLFSANLDDTTYTNLRAWRYEGKNLMESPHIAGALTNSHLVMQETTEGAGAAKASKGHPVHEPSKDLRIFDESLQRVVIVDDNPLRLFQFRNTRLFKKFHACGSDLDGMKSAYGGALRAVIDELVDSAEHAKRAGVPFATAFLPHSVLGQVTVRFLMETNGWDEARAVAFVRAHPDVVDARY